MPSNCGEFPKRFKEDGAIWEFQERSDKGAVYALVESTKGETQDLTLNEAWGKIGNS